jgi:hypothetical protein
MGAQACPKRGHPSGLVDRPVNLGVAPASGKLSKDVEERQGLQVITRRPLASTEFDATSGPRPAGSSFFLRRVLWGVGEKISRFRWEIGGECEIRTHGRLSTSPVFKTGAFDRSANSPGLQSLLPPSPCEGAFGAARTVAARHAAAARDQPGLRARPPVSARSDRAPGLLRYGPQLKFTPTEVPLPMFAGFSWMPRSGDCAWIAYFPAAAASGAKLSAAAKGACTGAATGSRKE